MGEAVEVVREALANARRVSQTRDTRSVIAPQESIRALLAERDALLVLLEALVRAWETLPGGKQQPVRAVERWLSDDMKPAVDEARALLSRLNEDKPNG
jgi:hypothetical protein